MKTMLFATALAASTLTAVTARAADLTEGAAPHSWSGIYLGIQGGGAWARADDGADRFNLNGGAIGAYIGANWQVDAFVLGIEGDVAYTSNDRSVFGFELGTRWQGALRGRLGYAVDRVLIYGAAGLALSEVWIDAAPVLDKTETFTGWTVGGGVEYAFADDWAARVDYRYSDYGASDFGWSDTSGFEVTEHALRIGVGYSF
ncbi:MAG TPA: outer membrane protein [Rhizobiaceae bacterium]